MAEGGGNRTETAPPAAEEDTAAAGNEIAVSICGPPNALSVVVHIDVIFSGDAACCLAPPTVGKFCVEPTMAAGGISMTPLSFALGFT